MISGVIIPTLLAVRFGTVLSRDQASVQTFGNVPQSESVGVGDLNSKTKVFENKFSIKLDAQFEYQEDQCTVNGFVHLSWLDNFFSYVSHHLASEECPSYTPSCMIGALIRNFFPRSCWPRFWVRHEVRRVFPFPKKSFAWIRP